jgi:hypothetical protein
MRVNPPFAIFFDTAGNFRGVVKFILTFTHVVSLRSFPPVSGIQQQARHA